MEIVDVQQGTPEWHAYRADHWNASDAPAMMGVSPYKTRTQLLQEKYTGLQGEVTAQTQRLFDNGHSFEAYARPLAEQITGCELYPVVASDGPYSASFDGITMAEDLVFEHKTLNDELRACLPVAGAPIDGDVVLPPAYRIQLEQQLMISGAPRALFMASKWTQDGTLVEERHCWYVPNYDLRAQIIAGWAQFEADLQAYEPAAAAAPTPVGKAPETLPALLIEVRGQVTSSNLAPFKTAALAVIRGVNRDLKTDEDFANAEKAVKWCEDVEERLAGAKQQALSQTATIDALFRTIDEISAEARDVRLALTRDVKARKESIKGEIVAGALAAFGEHLRAMNCPWLPRVVADFAGAAKNKRTVASLRDAVDTELARVKIEANGHYQRITQNLKTLDEVKDMAFLFSDVGTLVLKAPDDLALVIRARIADHEAKEAQRLEAERVRIRAEEQARADREAAAKVQAEQAAERQRAEDRARQIRLAEMQTNAPVIAPPPSGVLERGESGAGKAMIPTPAPKADEPATLNLGAISERLEFTVNAVLMAKFKFEGAPGPRGSKLYTESQYTSLCYALARHCTALATCLEAA